MLDEEMNHSRQLICEAEYWLIIRLSPLNMTDFPMFQIDFYDQYSDIEIQQHSKDILSFVICNILMFASFPLAKTKAGKRLIDYKSKIYIITIMSSTITLTHLLVISSYAS